jgi:hypothetical protein
MPDRQMVFKCPKCGDVRKWTEGDPRVDVGPAEVLALKLRDAPMITSDCIMCYRRDKFKKDRSYPV